MKIPDEYILKRWTKNAKKNIGDALMENLKFESNGIVKFNGDAGTFEIASNGIVKLIEEINANLENITLGVSKSGLKQTSTVEKLKKTQDEGQISGEGIVNGWKSK